MRKLANALLSTLALSMFQLVPVWAAPPDPCYTLTETVLTDGSACSGAVTIGAGVTSIADSAFADNTNLTSVTIPTSVTTIGMGAFYGTALTSVTIPNSVTTLEENAFFGNESLTSVTIGNSLGVIGNYAFYENTALTEVVIGDSVTIIGEGAFQKTALTSLTIPDTVTTIGSDAFQDSSLSSVVIGNSVRTIGSGAFQNTRLTSLVIPNSVTTIGENAFRESTLTSVSFGNSVRSIGRHAFQQTRLTSLVIPNSVTTIGDDAFRETAISSVVISDSVNIIENGTFFGNDSLTSVTIPNSVTSIGAGAFSDSDALASVVIGSSVTDIFLNAFYRNISLTSVRFLGNAPVVGRDVFSGIPETATAYVSNTAISSFTLAGTPPKWNGLIVVNSFTNANLSALTLSSGNLSPDFLTSTTSYNTSVTNSTSSITVNPTKSDSNATIQVRVNGESYTGVSSGSASSPLSLNIGLNTIDVKVTAEDGITMKTYTTTVTRAAPSSSGAAPSASVPVIPTYQITYSGNASDVVTTPSDFNSYTSGQKITVTSQLPVRTGYSFVEWNTSSSGGGMAYKTGATITVGSNNETLYAQWKINQYTINFDSNGGPTLKLNQITQDFNSTITVPALPQDALRIGYTFLGWNTKADGSGSPFAPSDKLQIGAANITLFVQWKINQYIVNYQANGNEIGRVPATVTQDFNSKVIVSAPSPVFTRKGYTFSGWSMTIDGSGTSFKFGDTFILGASNQTLYAIWTPETYLVTFLNTSKDPLPKGQFLTGGVITSAPTPPSRKGFLFKGWSSKADKSNIVAFPYAPGVIRNVTLYAVWAKSK